MFIIFLFLFGIPIGLFLAWTLISLVIAIIVNAVKVGFGGDVDDAESFGERWKHIIFFWTYLF